ncbi:ABC-F type ribosomal protection protein [Metasolibacillus sp. FSL H7-0170]|uniref:ribosomal protection-like ABC-F family protein n=1 Tax=Metasolibacillus TaxID=2703677 RepID=UPI000D3C080B|nr:ABC-F type ribosomal protection protein [Metasolibacillus fluoroglycofenilyticus]
MEQLQFEIKQLTHNYLDKEILKIPYLAVHQLQRIGIVGNNGAGKSTLLKLLAGRISPTIGHINSFVDALYMDQIDLQVGNHIDYALQGKLNVGAQHAHLSGGEQTRLKLAELLSTYAPCYLLDEPTSHLDQDGIQFLIDELTYYYGTLIIVSHDRALLDAVVDTIWEVKNGAVHVYTGNYSAYKEQKELERQMQQQAHETYIKEKGRLEAAAADKMKRAEQMAQAKSMSRKEAKAKPNRMFETKSKASGQKALHRAAKAMEERVQQLQAVEKPEAERIFHFAHQAITELHNKVPILANDFTLMAGDKLLLQRVSFQIRQGQKIAITGANGSGKSTLLKAIAEGAEGIDISPKVKIGYFRQMSYQFEASETLLQFAKSHAVYDEGFLRKVLAAMHFTQTDLRKSVRDLSGGEAMRLQLALLFVGDYNVLLLDEPTNFLDITLLEALEQFILGYQGTVLIVSHDASFLKQTTTVRYHLAKQKLILQ